MQSRSIDDYCFEKCFELGTDASHNHLCKRQYGMGLRKTFGKGIGVYETCGFKT